MSEIATVLCEFGKWGVPNVCVRVNASFPEDGFVGPTNLACITWPDRTVHFRPGVAAQDLIHELTHCVVRDYIMRVDEIESGMLALHWWTHRKLQLSDASWDAFVSDYGAGQFATYDAWDVGDLSTRAFRRIMAASREGAVERGLMYRNGRPTYRKQPDPEIPVGRG